MSVPGASATYRALLKHAMRPRQERVLFLAAIGTHLLMCIALGSPRALWRGPVGVGSGVLTVLVVLPTLLERRARLIYAPEPVAYTATSRGGHALALLRTRAVWTRAGQLAARAALAAAVYAATATHTYGWHTRWAPSVYIASHDAYYVNEMLLLLLWTAAWAGAVFGLYQAWTTPRACWEVPAFDPDWVVHPRGLRERTMSELGARIPRALLLVPVLSAPYALYVAFRDVFWAGVLRLVGVESWVRPWLVPSFRVAFRPWYTAWVLVPVCAFVLMLLTLVYTLFDVYWTQPLPLLSPQTRDPNATLLGGLNDPHPFFAAHAFSELARSAMYDPERRRVLFDDVQRVHGRPVAWTEVCAACVHRLDAFVPRKAPQQASHTQSEAPPPATPGVWQALAQTRAPREAAPPAEVRAAPPRADTPLFCIVRITSWALGALAKAAFAAVPSDAKHALLPQAVHLAFAAPSPRLVLDTDLLAQRAVVCWAALSLHYLAEASLKEDQYGSVQKDVPRMATALLGAHARLQSLRTRAEHAAVDADNQLVREAHMVRSALREAGADAATFSTSYAPFLHELQTTWHRTYAVLDRTLDQGARHIVQTFAPYGIDAQDRM